MPLTAPTRFCTFLAPDKSIGRRPKGGGGGGGGATQFAPLGGVWSARLTRRAELVAQNNWCLCRVCGGGASLVAPLQANGTRCAEAHYQFFAHLCVGSIQRDRSCGRLNCDNFEPISAGKSNELSAATCFAGAANLSRRPSLLQRSRPQRAAGEDARHAPRAAIQRSTRPSNAAAHLLLAAPPHIFRGPQQRFGNRVRFAR